MKTERILQSQGFGSRKECRSMIRAGVLRIQGEVVDNPFAEFPVEGLSFEVDGQLWHYREQAYLMLNKPAGYECSRKPTFHPSIFALLPAQFANRDIQPVGRLDQDTTGLLLLSDDGQFIHVWSSGKKQTPKRYRVTTTEAVQAGWLDRLLEGVQLHDEPALIKASSCCQTGEHELEMVITEGKYHQVKRMVVAAGGQVAALQRVQVGGLSLPDDLPEGSWRWLGEADHAALARF